MPSPVILFVYRRARDISLAAASHLWLARQVGFRPIITDWSAIRFVDQGITLANGQEIVARGDVRIVSNTELITPAIIFHRSFVHASSEHTLTELARALPNSRLSYIPPWKLISSKWDGEILLQNNESPTHPVTRPKTYLIANDAGHTLASIGRTRPLIFKPVGGWECWGISISTPLTFDLKTQELVASTWSRYVAQEVVDDVILLEGNKFDVRIYVLVTSFQPLTMTVFREGIARIAARPYRGENTDDLITMLTGSAYRERNGQYVDNILFTQLLPLLASHGYKVSDIWTEIDTLLTNAFSCFARCPQLVQSPLLSRAFYFVGVDLLLCQRDGHIKPVYLEANYAPSLNGWGASIDKQLHPLHRAWLEVLFRHCGKATACGHVD
jgi:hypothetical protein